MTSVQVTSSSTGVRNSCIDGIVVPLGKSFESNTRVPAQARNELVAEQRGSRPEAARYFGPDVACQAGRGFTQNLRRRAVARVPVPGDLCAQLLTVLAATEKAQVVPPFALFGRGGPRSGRRQHEVLEGVAQWANGA